MFSLLRLRRSRGPNELVVGMAGVKLGERLLQAGVGNPQAFAVLAGKAGLTGRACAVVETPAAAGRIEAAAADAGVLVEVATAEGGFWPYDTASFDVGLFDAGALASAGSRVDTGRLQEMCRVLRPGGRLLAVMTTGGGLWRRLVFAGSAAAEAAAGRELATALGAAGFRPVRVLAGREGMTFVEGFRPVS